MSGESEAELLEAFGTPLAAVPDPPDALAEAVTLARAAIERITFGVRLDDGSELLVETDARDHRAYVTLRDRLKLPTINPTDALDAGYFYAFAAWHAARYRHHLTTLDWPTWEGAVIGIDIRDDEAPDPLGTGPGRP